MSVHLESVAFDAAAPARLAAFWAGVLAREARPDARGVLLPGTDTQVGVRFVPSTSPRVGVNRMHLHLTSTDESDFAGTVAKALGLGASHLDVGQLPEEGHVVLADPEGNEFCVIDPGNSFLAGCGLLGEVACDGTRQIGLFWAEVLGWPLVWDENEETAIQAPAGGTKVAWGGPPLAPRFGRNRQHVELVASHDLTGEIARLLAAGATLLGRADAFVELADPDGNAFRLG
ncbi:MAG: VOC family protein [Tetrasphaera sp.]